MKQEQSFLADPSLWAVIAGNIFAIVIAYLQRWDLGEVMIAYLWQSIIIGLVSAWRIWSLKNFSTEGMTINNRKALPETVSSKRFVVLFFIVHYGFFHFVYWTFINNMFGLDMPGDNFSLAICILGFGAAHLYSRRYNASRDFRDSKPNLSVLMKYPYHRIFPMHLTIMAMGFINIAMGENSPLPAQIGLILFMLLKTYADAAMHIAEHRMFRSSEKTMIVMRD